MIVCDFDLKACKTVLNRVKSLLEKWGNKMTFWASVGFTLVGALIGGILTFYFTRKKFEKELKENPPINEKMIRAMFLQMGRKPSEAQIRQIMKSVNSNR